MKRFILLVLLAAAPALAATPDETLLRQLDHDITTATWKNDVAWFEAHLSDDYVLTTSSGRIVGRAAFLAAVRSPVAIEPYEPTEVVVHVVGETAIITGRIEQKYVLAGEAVDADLRYTDVWLKTSGGWKYAAGHASAISIKRSKVEAL